MNFSISQNPDNYKVIFDNYIEQIKNNKRLDNNTINKLITSIYVTKYTLEYFENENVKGVCSQCIKKNKENIITGLGATSLTSIAICASLGNPAEIIACFVGLNGVLSYDVICAKCAYYCNFCI